MESKTYIWQQKDWPNFSFDLAVISAPLNTANRELGKLIGCLEALGWTTTSAHALNVATIEAINTSAIEGEVLSDHDVRSSFARRLGIEVAGLSAVDRKIDGLVEVMLDASNYKEPLTEARLNGWHAALFPTGYSGMHQIEVGKYRTDINGPMQIVSGAVQREKVHYEAPPAEQLNAEMYEFLHWFNTDQGLDPLVKAAIAHLWFVTLHPYEDGNGRIGRALCETALAIAGQSSSRLYSLSTQIKIERHAYYQHLEFVQTGKITVTEWIKWFLECLTRAIKVSLQNLNSAIYLTKLKDKVKDKQLNKRQINVLMLLMNSGQKSISTGKYADITGCSTDTALRDIEELVEIEALEKTGTSKRGTAYTLKDYIPPTIRQIEI